MSILGRVFCRISLGFWSYLIMNGADCMVHLPDSTAMIICPIGVVYFPLLHAKFIAASSSGIF